MEKFISMIGPDCWDIIIYYKNEFERIEKNKKTIDSCIFEQFDRDILETIVNTDNTITESRYHLNEMTIKEFGEYYLTQRYILTITFKFTIMNQVEDYITLSLHNIDSKYLDNLRISYKMRYPVINKKIKTNF